MDFLIPKYSNFEIFFNSILKILLNYFKLEGFMGFYLFAHHLLHI